jgi:hypothetical protein
MFFFVVGRHDSEDEVQLDFSKGRSVPCREFKYVLFVTLLRGVVMNIVSVF